MDTSIKLVVFDIAGTTVKDNGEIALAFQSAMNEKRYSIPVEKINPLMGYKKPEAIRMMLNEYETDKSIINEGYINNIHSRFLQIMIDYYTNTSDLQALPHAEEVFKKLKENGIKVGLDTGFSSDITNVIMQRIGWLKDGKIDYVVSSDEVPSGRPQPFMIRKMMQSAGIEDAKQVVKIGDTEVDINEGKNAGCLYAVAITTGAFTRQQLTPYEPSFIIDDLRELLTILEIKN
jgi:phosphonatase-like hydrolase